MSTEDPGKSNWPSAVEAIAVCAVIVFIALLCFGWRP